MATRKSRFFEGSSSESESEEEQLSGEDEAQGGGFQIPSKFAKSSTATTAPLATLSDDDEPKKRVVKSKKDKQMEEINDTIKRIKNGLKNNDWTKIGTDFDKLNKQITNPKFLEAQEAEGKKGTPRFYIRTLYQLEEGLQKTGAAKQTGAIKMNAANLKAFNAMKQKLKKHNKNYEKELEEFRKNPDEGDEEGKEEEEGSDGEGFFAKEEDDSFFAKSVSKRGEEEDEDEEAEDQDEEVDTQDKKINPWFLGSGATTKKAEEGKKKDRTTKEGKGKKKAGEEGLEVAEKDEKKPADMTPEEIRKKLQEILTARGKKSTNTLKQVEKLTDLLNFATEPELQLEIYVNLISAQFDVTRGANAQMSPALWQSVHSNLTKLLTILDQNRNLVLHESEDPNDELPSQDEEAEEKMVSGSLRAFIERLDDEFIKSLQSIDPHTQEYVQRLLDENAFLELAEKAQNYYERNNQLKSAARVAQRRVEHIYYKLETHERAPVKIEESSLDNNANPAKIAETLAAATRTYTDNKELLGKLSHLILQHGDERMKTRTMLCLIYHNALHERFYEARDMMLISHLQENIQHMDIPTQILFNRAMVQLGLCAFRNNLIKQAHSCLSEICATNRLKELLAQGVTNTRFQEKSVEQERLERKRQLPFHMHINLEMLEAIHLICALLLEVPNMAASHLDTKKKQISKPFRRLLDIWDRRAFTGPPENTRDVIVQASKHLGKGEWKRCEELILGLPIWSLVQRSDQVKAVVRRKIQEEGLRTYLFTYSSYYESMSAEQLSLMFELPKNTVHAIVSKMINSEELHASWDQPTGSLVLHKVSPTRVQYLAMLFAEKAATFMENNERLLDTRMAGYGYKSENKPRDQKGWSQDQGRQNQNRQQQQQQKGRYQRQGQSSGGYQQQHGHQHQQQHGHQHQHQHSRQRREGGGQYQHH